MSQLGHAVRTVITKAVKSKWTVKETADFFNEFVWCFDFGTYSDDMTEEEIVRNAEYMATQYDGCYGGLTADEIKKWIEKL